MDKDYKKSKDINIDTHEYSFDKAGLNKTIWEDYNEKATIIGNIKFKAISFRESIFSKVRFINISNYSASFESAKILNCNFDSFNLEHSSCRAC